MAATYLQVGVDYSFNLQAKFSEVFCFKGLLEAKSKQNQA